MIVKIFEPQLSIWRVNRWTQGAQIFSELICRAAEFEPISIDIRGRSVLQLVLRRIELRLAVILRPLRWFRPRIGLILRRGHDEECAPLHHMREQGEPIAHAECFLFHAIEWFLRAFLRVRFIGDAAAARKDQPTRQRKIGAAFCSNRVAPSMHLTRQAPSARLSNHAFPAWPTKENRSAAIAGRLCRYSSIFR